jgi:hypothetical protein
MAVRNADAFAAAVHGTCKGCFPELTKALSESLDRLAVALAQPGDPAADRAGLPRGLRWHRYLS